MPGGLSGIQKLKQLVALYTDYTLFVPFLLEYDIPHLEILSRLGPARIRAPLLQSPPPPPPQIR